MPFRTRSILVASDLSETTRDAVMAAGELARLTEADLHVVHAVERDVQPPEDAPRHSTPYGMAWSALQTQLHEVFPPGVDAISSRVLIGRADEVILRRAREVDADLLVVGPHRRGADEGRHLGTTADRLVRTADVPCLIVHGRLTLPLRCVIIPSDLSDAANGALDIGLTWSAALRLPTRSAERTIVEVLYVRPSGAAAHAAGAAESSGRSRTVEQAVEESMERTGVGELLKLEPREVEGPDAAAEVLKHAKETNANLLVLGTHGESAQLREQIGSVSSEVAQEADCPVLLVPPALWRTRQERERRLWQRRGDDSSGN